VVVGYTLLNGWIFTLLEAIEEEWNWLDGTSPEDLIPKNIHFTTGGPVYPEWIGKRDIDNKYADEWRDFFSTVVKG
jgi:hypothetical protein